MSSSNARRLKTTVIAQNMKYNFDGSKIKNIEDFHTQLVSVVMNSEPQYYGFNLDALYDILCGGHEISPVKPCTFVFKNSKAMRRNLQIRYKTGEVSWDVLMDIISSAQEITVKLK